MKYSAVTFDTQTIYTNSFHFDGGLLALFGQFSGQPLSVVISEVVDREVIKGLTEKTREAKEKVEQAHKKAVDFGLIQSSARPIPGGEPDIRVISKARWSAYLNSIGALTIPVDNVSVRELTRLYFSNSPPFSASGKKKNEFPDAIALLSLENWAKQRGKYILAVSKDGDWISFAKNSEHIDVIEDLGTALSILQIHTEQAKAAASKLLRELYSEETDLHANFTDKLDQSVSGYWFDGEAESSYHAESDQVDVSFNYFEAETSVEDFDFDVVQFDDKTLAIKLFVVANVDAKATFSLSMYDSVDKDYVPAGHAEVKRNVDVDIEVLVKFEGDISSGDVIISAVEVVEAPYSIEFGFIEPDYGEEYADPDQQDLFAAETERQE